jgi:hypothetical protein
MNVTQQTVRESITALDRDRLTVPDWASTDLAAAVLAVGNTMAEAAGLYSTALEWWDKMDNPSETIATLAKARETTQAYLTKASAAEQTARETLDTVTDALASEAGGEGARRMRAVHAEIARVAAGLKAWGIAPGNAERLATNESALVHAKRVQASICGAVSDHALDCRRGNRHRLRALSGIVPAPKESRFVEPPPKGEA